MLQRAPSWPGAKVEAASAGWRSMSGGVVSPAESDGGGASTGAMAWLRPAAVSRKVKVKVSGPWVAAVAMSIGTGRGRYSRMTGAGAPSQVAGPTSHATMRMASAMALLAAAGGAGGGVACMGQSMAWRRRDRQWLGCAGRGDAAAGEGGFSPYRFARRVRAGAFRWSRFRQGTGCCHPGGNRSGDPRARPLVRAACGGVDCWLRMAGALSW